MKTRLVTDMFRNLLRSKPVEDHIYHIMPLEECHARDILRWEYQTPYDFYNPPVDEHRDHYISMFLKPELRFHAVLDQHENLIGFCSYGIDGQVPGGNYDEDALDIGLGMKPEFTGQGRGEAFFDAVVDYAMQTINPSKLRLTVANFNRRAFHLYENFGFEAADEFFDSLYKVPYTILIKGV
jgi:RimJ/RimL family protein N-acetyltransferase